MVKLAKRPTSSTTFDDSKEHGVITQEIQTTIHHQNAVKASYLGLLERSSSCCHFEILIFSTFMGLSIGNTTFSIMFNLNWDNKKFDKLNETSRYHAEIKLMRLSLPEQIRNHEKPENEIIHIRGPGNSAFLIEMIPSKDVYEVRFLLKNFILSKHGCKYEEPGTSQFERHGYVLTKPLEDYYSALRKAFFHVKAVGAEDVIELKKERQLKFLCSPNRIFVTAYKLNSMGYEIESSGIHYFPKYVVGLKKNDRALCEKFLRVMNQLPNVLCIYDNIRRDLI